MNETTSELSEEPKVRVHIQLFKSDWDWLGRAYGDSVKRSNVMRRLLRDYRRRIEAKVEQKL